MLLKPFQYGLSVTVTVDVQSRLVITWILLRERFVFRERLKRVETSKCRTVPLEFVTYSIKLSVFDLYKGRCHRQIMHWLPNYEADLGEINVNAR